MLFYSSLLERGHSCQPSHKNNIKVGLFFRMQIMASIFTVDSGFKLSKGLGNNAKTNMHIIQGIASVAESIPTAWELPQEAPAGAQTTRMTGSHNTQADHKPLQMQHPHNHVWIANPTNHPTDGLSCPNFHAQKWFARGFCH